MSSAHEDSLAVEHLRRQAELRDNTNKQILLRKKAEARFRVMGSVCCVIVVAGVAFLSQWLGDRFLTTHNETMDEISQVTSIATYVDREFSSQPGHEGLSSEFIHEAHLFPAQMYLPNGKLGNPWGGVTLVEEKGADYVISTDSVPVEGCVAMLSSRLLPRAIGITVETNGKAHTWDDQGVNPDEARQACGLGNAKITWMLP